MNLTCSGPVVMLWSWIVVGVVTLLLVSSLGEICCAYPTMGALYYWAYRLGGDEWGPFSSWMAGWTNLLGQVAGVASGGYSGAEVLGDIATLTSGVILTPVQLLAVYAVVLIFAGIVNTFAEQLLTRLCSISVIWHIVGTILIVALMINYAPSLKSSEYVAFDYNNATPFESKSYVILIGSLAAASTFTGTSCSLILHHISQTLTQESVYCKLNLLQVMTQQLMSPKRRRTLITQLLLR